VDLFNPRVVIAIRVDAYPIYVITACANRRRS
jgi:hypothetical protein